MTIDGLIAQLQLLTAKQRKQKLLIIMDRAWVEAADDIEIIKDGDEDLLESGEIRLHTVELIPKAVALRSE